jgi:hypothetical protein
MDSRQMAIQGGLGRLILKFIYLVALDIHKIKDGSLIALNHPTYFIVLN